MYIDMKMYLSPVESLERLVKYKSVLFLLRFQKFFEYFIFHLPQTIIKP